MMTKRQLFSFAAVLTIALTGCNGHADRENCVERDPTLERRDAGYELIDLRGRRVWLTTEWTPDEYANFSLPFSRVFWRKNDPRIGLPDQSRFLRSPGCDSDGQFTYMHAFDREFLQVVRLGKIHRPRDGYGLIRRIELKKHHVLTFTAGRTVSILENPAGEQFILVSRSLDRLTDTPTLPDDWTLEERSLTENLQVDLVGNVSVLRLDNEDSYQGPLQNL